MASGQIIGYRRVSTAGQNTARQLDGMALDQVFEDKCSGSTVDRPALAAMLIHARSGDTVVVHEISRLARNTADLLDLVKKFTAKGVTVKFIKESLTFAAGTNNPMNTMLLTIIGAISAFELSMINERRAEGQAKARAEGKHMGRTAKLTVDQITAIKQRAATESKTALADEYGVSRATLYSVLKAA